MSLYINDKKYKVMLNGKAYILNQARYVIDPAYITDDPDTIIPVEVKYYIYEDADNDVDVTEPLNYPAEESPFVFSGYLRNNKGSIVPVFYEADWDDETGDFIGPDYDDPFYYVGTFEVDDVIYDRWQQINALADQDWEDTKKNYILTNRIVLIH